MKAKNAVSPFWLPPRAVGDRRKRFFPFHDWEIWKPRWAAVDPGGAFERWWGSTFMPCRWGLPTKESRTTGAGPRSARIINEARFSSIKVCEKNESSKDKQTRRSAALVISSLRRVSLVKGIIYLQSPPAGQLQCFNGLLTARNSMEKSTKHESEMRRRREFFVEDIFGVADEIYVANTRKENLKLPGAACAGGVQCDLLQKATKKNKIVIIIISKIPDAKYQKKILGEAVVMNREIAAVWWAFCNKKKVRKRHVHGVWRIRKRKSFVAKKSLGCH